MTAWWVLHFPPGEPWLAVPVGCSAGHQQPRPCGWRRTSSEEATRRRWLRSGPSPRPASLMPARDWVS